MNIKCKHCHKLFEFKSDTLTIRYIKGDFRQVSLVCTHCNTVNHKYYIDDKIEGWQKKLKKLQEKASQSNAMLIKYKREKEKYQKYFDEIQGE